MIGIWYSGTRYLFSHNIQGDIISIHNDAGDVVARYTYDAYGNHQVLTSSGALDTNQSSIGNINPFRYRGYYYDVETGLYYLNSRYYDPRIGRFISPDIMSILDETMMDANGLNLYMYCGNNPVMRVDPTGYFVITLAIALAALFAGAIIGGLYGAATAAANGQNIIAGLLIGAGAGALMGLGVAMAGAFIAPVLLGTATIGGLSAGVSLTIGTGIAFGTGFIVGTGSDVALQSINNNGKIDWGASALTGIEWGVINVANAFTGGLAGDLTGFCINLLLSAMLNLLYGGIGMIVDIMRYHIPLKMEKREKSRLKYQSFNYGY